MKKIIDYRSIGTDGAALLLRLLLGGLMVFHGWGKIQAYDQYAPMFMDFMGLGKTLSFQLVIFSEFFCGLLLIVGFLTRFAVIPMGFTMGVAYFMAHGADEFTKKELPFTFMLLCIVVFILGSGKYSLDKLIFKPKP